jgi:hypothetical protein
LPADPALRYATYAWRPSDAVVNAGVIDSWPAYVGTATLLPGGAKKNQPAADALLNNQVAVPSASGVGYSVAMAAPTEQTFVFAGRYDTNSSGFMAHTVAGAVNSGQSLFYQSGVGVSARCLAATATVNPGAIASFVAVAIFRPTGATLYLNSYTPVTASGGPTALAGDSFRLFDISSAGVFPMNGAVRQPFVTNRAFTNAEAAYALATLGAEIGVTIAP